MSTCVHVLVFNPFLMYMCYFFLFFYLFPLISLSLSLTLSLSLSPSLLSDYYEEMLTLLDLFTCESISPVMWQVLGLIYDAFTRDGFDYFSGLQLLH